MNPGLTRSSCLRVRLPEIWCGAKLSRGVYVRHVFFSIEVGWSRLFLGLFSPVHHSRHFFSPVGHLNWFSPQSEKPIGRHWKKHDSKARQKHFPLWALHHWVIPTAPPQTQRAARRRLWICLKCLWPETIGSSGGTVARTDGRTQFFFVLFGEKKTELWEVSEVFFFFQGRFGSCFSV